MNQFIADSIQSCTAQYYARMVTNPLRIMAKKAGSHGRVGTIEAIVLRETSRMLITARAWLIQRSSGDIEMNLKLTQERRSGGLPTGEPVNITLRPAEVDALHGALHDFLSLAGKAGATTSSFPCFPIQDATARTPPRNSWRSSGSPASREN